MSFKVNICGEEKTLNHPTKILSLIDNREHKYVAAMVNNQIRELTFELNQESAVDLLTVKNRGAMRIYETSLRYLVCMAMEKIRPGLKIRLSYNVSRSIFVQILDTRIHADNSIVKDLFVEMKKIVARDIPFVRQTITNEKAKEIFKEKGYEDKLEILKYRPESTTHLYECDGYLNYMYGRMVPSTGYLKDWEIRLYSPGIIVQYPRSECNGDIPPFQDMPTFGRTLKESHKWGKIAGADSIAGINHHIEKSGTIDFINMCESRHNRMLCELGQKIENDIENIRLICIAGPSSSGKTTFSNRLRVELLSRGIKPLRLSIDNYYLPREQAPKDENGDPDLEDIKALDVALFNQNMADLIAGEEVQLPIFNFKESKREWGRKLRVPFDQPIIIEGIHALNDQLTYLIPKHQKFKIYIAPQAQINIDDDNPMSLTDMRLIRRMVRDHKFRNASAECTMSMWPSVRKGEFKWIYDTQEGADFVFNSLLSYELCVLKKYAMPLLKDIKQDSPYFPDAERLIRMLKFFVNMDDKWVPCNSLLKEFIGGSCYEDAE